MLATPALAALALALAAQDVANLPRWEELGPAPIVNGPYTGRVSAVALSATDPNRYYVAGADGGVWRSDDGGQGWTPLTDDLPTQAIGALAIDPTDHDVLYAGTGEANYANHSRYGLGLFKTVDGGQTWEHLGEQDFAGRTFARIAIDPTDTQTLYAAIGRAGGFPELAAAKGHPDATGDVGIWKSTDGGVSWARLTGGLPNLAATDLALHPTQPDVVYAGIGRIFGHAQNGVYRSTDGGATWTRLGGALPTGHGRVSLGTSPAQPDRVYALITNPASGSGGGATTRGAYRSDDAGNTWVALPSLGNIQSSYGWYLSVIAVRPTNASVVFMGGLSLMRSTNAGGGWSTVTPPHVDLHAAAWDAAGRLVVGDDGGVHRSSDLGASWEPLNQGLGLIQLYAGLSSHPTADETFFGGFQDNGTNRRSGPTKSWTHVLGGDGGWTQLDPAQPSRVFGELQGTANLYRSQDGGASFNWTASGIDSGDRHCFLPPYLIEPGDPTRMLYATHRVYRSTNSGVSWSAISGDLTNGAGAIRCLAQSESDPSVVYAATNDGNVLRSDNGGSTWTTLLTGQPGWPRVTRELAVHPHHPRTVYLAGAAFGVDQVRRSRDGGLSWKSLDGDLPDVPVNVVDVLVDQGQATLFAGTDAGLYWSPDGASWRPYGVGLPRAAVIDLTVDKARRRIVVATQGRGVWRAPLVLPKGS